MSDGMKGQFVWHELMTTDAKAAVGFYSKVARLTTQPAPFDKTYTTFMASGRPMGGLMVLAGGAPPNWLSYIGTADVDETTRKAQSLGAKVVKASAPVADGGRFAILEDPQGAVFAIYAFKQGQGGDAPSTDVPLGHSSWHELATADPAAAFSFYQQLFGWHTTSSMDMGAQGVYRMFGPAGAKDPLGGMYMKAPGSPGGPNWLPYIKVADARPATATAKKNGAQILHGPAQVPGGGWITMGIDPQGAMFAVHSVAARPRLRKPRRRRPRKRNRRRKRKRQPRRRPRRRKRRRRRPRPQRKRRHRVARKRRPDRRSETDELGGTDGQSNQDRIVHRRRCGGRGVLLRRLPATESRDDGGRTRGAHQSHVGLRRHPRRARARRVRARRRTGRAGQHEAARRRHGRRGSACRLAAQGRVRECHGRRQADARRGSCIPPATARLPWSSSSWRSSD